MILTVDWVNNIVINSNHVFVLKLYNTREWMWVQYRLYDLGKNINILAIHNDHPSDIKLYALETDMGSIQVIYRLYNVDNTINTKWRRSVQISTHINQAIILHVACI